MLVLLYAMLDLADKLTELQNKYTSTWLIIAGDFN